MGGRGAFIRATASDLLHGLVFIKKLINNKI
jgi:hypothetical protein